MSIKTGTFQISYGNSEAAQKKRASRLSFFASFSSIPAVGAELAFVHSYRLDCILEILESQAVELESLPYLLDHRLVLLGLAVRVLGKQLLRDLISFDAL